jgi:hypothetical protein
MIGRRKLAFIMRSKVATPDLTPTASVQEQAARRLREARLAAGLTVEETAEFVRCAPTTIWRREQALVDLGALEQLVALEAIAAARKEAA